MNINMRNWVAQQIAAPVKRPLPLLSFPCVQMMDITVRKLISDSALQAEGLKRVADRVPAAAAVSLMDLSVEAEAFGSTIRVSNHEVPTVTGAIVMDEDDADDLEIPEIGDGRTGIYIDAIRQASQTITDRPLFAGVIGPYSLAGRLLDVTEAMIYCYEEPDMVHTVLDKATEFLTRYCLAYKEAGANGVVIAEPLAGLLSPSLAREFSHPYVAKLIATVQDDHFAVIYHNCGDNVPLMVEDIYRFGAMGYHFGDSIDMTAVLPGAPEDALIMGNVSPAAQFFGGTPASIREATLSVMERCCQAPNFVISSGCDIPPKSSWDNVDAFFAAAAEFYRKEGT